MATELANPADPAELARLLKRSPLVPTEDLRAHWTTLLPWLSVDARLELAAALLAAEQALVPDSE